MRPGRFAVVVTLAGLLLAGCSQPQSGVAAPATVTVTPSPGHSALSPASTSTQSATSAPFATPSAAPPMPSTATEITPAGAEAFARYWIEAYNWMLVSGDNDLFISSSANECGPCQELNAQSERGDFISGGLLQLNDVWVSGDVSPARTDVRIEYRQQESVEKSPGHEPTTISEVSAERVLVLVADRQGWMVVGVTKP